MMRRVYRCPPASPRREVNCTHRRQSDCPFQAYARYRLQVDKLESPVDGIDSRLAGETVHSILECVWSKWGSSKALEALSDTERAELVEGVTSLKKLIVKDTEVATTAIFDVERQSC